MQSPWPGDAENGPGPEEYRTWYEEFDPATAETLYKQVILQQEESKEIQEFAESYSSMKPKEAAGIFNEMTDNLNEQAEHKCPRIYVGMFSQILKCPDP